MAKPMAQHSQPIRLPGRRARITAPTVAKAKNGIQVARPPINSRVVNASLASWNAITSPSAKTTSSHRPQASRTDERGSTRSSFGPHRTSVRGLDRHLVHGCSHPVSLGRASTMTVPRTLRATVRSQLMTDGRAIRRDPGAVVGPRDSGQLRSTTVPHGQSQPQLGSRIGRDGVEGPYMACKGSGVQIPSAPPAQRIGSTTRRPGPAARSGARAATVGVTTRPLVAEGRLACRPARRHDPAAGGWRGGRLLGPDPGGARPVAVHAAWQTDAQTAVQIVLAATRRARTSAPRRPHPGPNPPSPRTSRGEGLIIGATGGSGQARLGEQRRSGRREVWCSLGTARGMGRLRRCRPAMVGTRTEIYR